ncbi:uncharacterized protein PHALS_10097 [Plasmopara halstedii]|uniref:Uncharacterized protein n=1 Tax=Plasmopara halstedii TaxID=4781 RepID=A0A0P1AGT7_PLAHL|nr:uncharacterized protein PHALS_10097 [Plasmopara halstedii]CEG39866.1 hypothetical protein PHALS_10097 [Plasmopara halstedii]|eukprot:XP_024576235.1 hypothetical protein PHALS_10097 [Plasmopara halstedii]
MGKAEPNQREIPVKEQTLGVPELIRLSLYIRSRWHLGPSSCIGLTGAYIDETVFCAGGKFLYGVLSSFFRDEAFYFKLQRYIRALFDHVINCLD